MFIVWTNRILWIENIYIWIQKSLRTKTISLHVKCKITVIRSKIKTVRSLDVIDPIHLTSSSVKNCMFVVIYNTIDNFIQTITNIEIINKWLESCFIRGLDVWATICVDFHAKPSGRFCSLGKWYCLSNLTPQPWTWPNPLRYGMVQSGISRR